jgi:hypothetical protein
MEYFLRVALSFVALISSIIENPSSLGGHFFAQLA